MKKNLFLSITMLLCMLMCSVPVHAQVDMTAHIINPSFETGDVTGWSWYGYNPENEQEAERDVTASLTPASQSGSTDPWTMTNVDGERVCDFYLWAWTGWWSYYTIYQTIPSLPAGRYELSAVVASHADRQVSLFAGTPSTVMNDASSSVYTNKTTIATTDRAIGIPVSVIFELPSEQDVTIGAGLVNVPSWWEVFFKADNFRLTLLGDDPLIRTEAVALPGSLTQLTAGKWYYYDVPADGDYGFSATNLNNFIYTTNGNQSLSGTISATTLSSAMSLTAGQRIYIKPSTAATLTVTVPSSLNYVGTAVGAGEWYIYNLASKTYLNLGSSYLTHLTVDGAGRVIDLAKTGTSYQVHFAGIDGGKFMGSDGWGDKTTTDENYTAWTFELVDQPGFTNIYKLKANTTGNYLYWAGGNGQWGNECLVNGDHATKPALNSYWIVVPKATRENLSAATFNNPVDATFLVLNPDMEADAVDDQKATVNWEGGFYHQYNGAEGTVANFIEVWCGEYRTGTGTLNDGVYTLNDTEVSQRLDDLPAGKYRISVSGAAWQQSDNSLSVTGIDFFAGTKKVTMSGFNSNYSVNFAADGVNAVKVGCSISSTNANWVYFDKVRLEYFGPIALPLPNDEVTELTEGQWYYYEVNSLGIYNLDGNVADFVYTQNGDNLVDENPATKTAQSTLILDGGLVYFMPTKAGNTLKITSVNDEGVSTNFSIATLNVDGLPNSILGININPDGPGAAGTRLISKYLADKAYDLIAVQEDFAYNSELAGNLSGYGQGTYRGNVSPTAIITPVNTDGLNFFWDETKGRYAFNESWTRFNHSESGDGNNYIKKGWRYYAVQLDNGMMIDVYMTHMDAGDVVDSRNIQWTEMANAVIANNFTMRPKIILGDFNSRYTREAIIANFINPVVATGNYTVNDAWVEKVRSGSYPNVGDATITNEVVDKIIYLNPTATNALKLTLKTYTRETDYTYGVAQGTSDPTPLGDHAPVVATFTAQLPAMDLKPIQDRWAWKSEEPVFGSEDRYLYNLHWGLYADAKQGFLADDGTLVRDPNNAATWGLWGDASGFTASRNSGKRLYMDYSTSLTYTAGLRTSRATTMYLTNGYIEGYKFTRDFSGTIGAGTKYFNAKNPNNEYSSSGTYESEQSDWLIISPEQKAKYDSYVAAWDKAYLYVSFLPLDENTKNELQALLEKTGVYWKDGTTEEIIALNEQIESWFDDDQTANIVNPSFELQNATTPHTTATSYTNYDVYGWTVPHDVEEAFILNKNMSGDGWIPNLNDVDGNYVFHTWGGTPANGFYVRQTISGLPEGFYKLKAVATTDAGNAISMQIGSSTQTTPFTVSRPYSQHLEVPLYYHNGEGDIVISASSNTWFEIDDFRLYRYEYYYDETITDAEYTTTAIRYNTEIPAGVEVYYATAIKAVQQATGGTVRNLIHLEKYEGGQLKACEGVVLYKAGNTADKQFRFYRTNDEVDYIEGNILDGTLVRIEADEKSPGFEYYMLDQKTITYDKVITTVTPNPEDIEKSTITRTVEETTEPVVGFYKLATETAIKANKAYLRVNIDDEALAQLLYFLAFGDEWDEDETTAVKQVETDTEATVIAIYSVGGARQNQLQRGINIVRMSDGSVKKVLVK